MVGDRRYAGGIAQLSALVRDHRVELVADFRAIYSVGAWDVRPREFVPLVRALLSNPSSSFHAAVAGWMRPLSYEGVAALDLYDLLYQSFPRRGRFKPYPRPWPDKSTKRLGGSNQRRSIAEVRKLLRPEP